MCTYPTPKLLSRVPVLRRLPRAVLQRMPRAVVHWMYLRHRKAELQSQITCNEAKMALLRARYHQQVQQWHKLSAAGEHWQAMRMRDVYHGTLDDLQRLEQRTTIIRQTLTCVESGAAA